MSRLDDLQAFYALLDAQAAALGGPRLLGDLSLRNLPRRGVYFFFEEGERRSNSGRGPRVTRVGTHALTAGSRSTLSQRLRQHRGKTNGGGNHRGSIFRLLVGQALLASGRQEGAESWGIKGDARQAGATLGVEPRTLLQAEEALEQAVSDVLRQMSVLWLDIPDDPNPRSLRGEIERGAITLLSNCGRAALDPASPTWLGRHSNRAAVRDSGLWNQRHVTEAHDPSFLARLEQLIRHTSA